MNRDPQQGTDQTLEQLLRMLYSKDMESAQWQQHASRLQRRVAQLEETLTASEIEIPEELPPPEAPQAPQVSEANRQQGVAKARRTKASNQTKKRKK